MVASCIKKAQECSIDTIIDILVLSLVLIIKRGIIMKRAIAWFLGNLLMICFSFTSYATSTIPKEMTPNYKVAFYAFDCYNMQDENGKRVWL